MTCPASNAIRYSRKCNQQTRKGRESKGIANFIAATIEITGPTASLPVEEEILLCAEHGRQPAKVLFKLENSNVVFVYILLTAMKSARSQKTARAFKTKTNSAFFFTG